MATSSSVSHILKNVIHDSHHCKSATVEKQLILSYSQDLVHEVSRDTFLIPKHALLAICFHDRTDRKTPIDLLSTFGNCSCYNLVQLIETGQEELFKKIREEGSHYEL